MQMNGAKYPPKNSQSHMAWFITLHAGVYQKIAKSRYASRNVMEVSASLVGPENARGAPSRTARTAAREKLRTDVADMTADAKQRLNDFNSIQMGAVSFVFESSLSINRGTNNTERHNTPRPSILGSMLHDRTKYRATPQLCVARMIRTACNDGRLLRSHFILLLPFILPPSLEGTDISTQPACTHDRRPLNRIAVLITIALGK